MKKKCMFYMAAFLMTLGMSSCVNEEDFDLDRVAQTTIHPSVEANLLDVDFYLSDFFSFDSITDEDEGVELVTVYDENGYYDYMQINIDRNFRLNEEEIIDFNNVLDVPSIDLNLGTVTIPDLYGLETTFTLAENEDASIMIAPLEPIDEHRRIDSAILSNADIRVALNQTLPVTFKLVLYSNSIVSPQGKVLRDTLIVGENGTSDVIDLNNYTVMLESVAGSDSSKIDLHYDLIAEINSSTTAGDYDMGITLSFSNGSLGLWDVALAYGKVGTVDLAFGDTININYFSGSNFGDIIKPGDFDFEEMFMNLTIRTNIGLGCLVDFSSLRTESPAGISYNLINGTQGLMLNRALSPLLPSETIYTFGRDTERTINTSAFEMLPDKFIYNVNFHVMDVDTIINGVTYPSFVYPTTSYIDMTTRISVPLKAKIANLSTVQNIGDMKFLQEDGGVGDYLESADLEIELTNSFPAAVEFNLVLKDANKQVYDTIFAEPIKIAAASVDNQGKVTTPTTTKFKRTITKEKYEALRQAPSIAAALSLMTATAPNGNQPYIKFEKDARINLKLKVKANTSIGFGI